jgi:probable rRNA maturation factor
MLQVVNRTRQPLPPLPFTKIATTVLGEAYELGLVFIGDRRSHQLNKTYRGKDKPTNVLSFPYSKKSGDLFIDLVYAKKEAPKYDHSYRAHILYLFIHGLLHLKGMDHGSKMEQREKQLFSLFNS